MRRAGFRWFAGCTLAVVGAFSARADVAVEFADGASASGSVTGLTDASLELVVEGSPRSVGIREVRSITWKQPEDHALKRPAVRVGLVDGSVLEGDDLAVSDTAASVVREGRKLTVARESIETAEFRSSGEDKIDGAGGNVPEWLANLREGGQERAVEADIVVVGSADKNELVECAIVAVTPDAVSVLLDGETIRVKRSKVIGLRWLRSREGVQAGGSTPPAGLVEFDGGRLLARRIGIEGDEVVVGLAVGEPIRVPLAAMRRIDFTAGRTVSLVSLEPDRVEVEPWFGLFKSLDGLADHFKPRRVAVPGGAVGGGPVGSGRREGVRLRPRTVIEWRLPEHSRSVAMTIMESSSVVAISIDGREAFRGQPSTPVPFVADATGGRRLTVTVDFPPSGPGTGGPAVPGVVLVEPRIER